MADSCTAFTPHLWKPNVCRNCGRKREDHPNLAVSDTETSDIPTSTLPQTTTDDDQSTHCDTAEQTVVLLIQESTQDMRPPCRYGLECYRTNPEHFERFSHPPEYVLNPVHQATTNDEKSPSRHGSSSKRKSDRKKREELEFIEQIERNVRKLMATSNLKDEEIENLRENQMGVVRHNQNLEKALADQLELVEKHDHERGKVLPIPVQAPSYWGPNAFQKPYHEIQLSNESQEYAIINDLLNSTITTHGNNFGTICGKDPTEFVVTQIRRIQNVRLWHEYCYKKHGIIVKNNNRIPESGSSNYLADHPLLMPLLDKEANEYWLFHGCSHNTVEHLLHTGYDPRVSNLKGMFGGGFYLAEHSSKSNQYIPCIKCNGNAISTSAGCSCSEQQQENFIFSMVLYRVVLGDVHVALTYDKQKYRNGSEKGKYVRRPPMKTAGQELYDSVMGESMKHGGDKLHHREFILYERGQAYPEYVINFRRSAKNACPPTDMERLQKRCQNFLKNTFRLFLE